MDESPYGIEPHIPALRRYARALLRDREAADDLVQDTLERAVSRWRQRRRDADLRAWLFSIQHNLFVDGIRARRRQGLSVPIEDGFELPSGGGDGESRLALRDVLACLDRLPDEQRAALLLVGVEELSYGETAGVLGVPIGTVMSRLSRGRERLRQMLDTLPRPTLRRVK